MYDGEQAAPLAPELQAFIEAGPAPVVFTAGTANTTSERFYAESAQACQRLNLRGILVAGQRSQLPGILPPDVVHVSHAAFSQLFPRSAAVVHHGGIGTLSQALRAGIPQLIRPMAYDQFDNASRACRLGVAKELLPRSYRGGSIGRGAPRPDGQTGDANRMRAVGRSHERSRRLAQDLRGLGRGGQIVACACAERQNAAKRAAVGHELNASLKNLFVPARIILRCVAQAC